MSTALLLESGQVEETADLVALSGSHVRCFINLLIISKIVQLLIPVVPEGILFQIKLGFPDDSESNCFSFVVRTECVYQLIC